MEIKSAQEAAPSGIVRAEKGVLSMSTSKPILAWDFDDILFPFMRTFFLEFHRLNYQTNFIFEDINTFELEFVLGCSWEEKQRRVEEFYASGLHDAMIPVEGAIEAAEVLSPFFTHIIITARPQKFEEQTRALLNRHGRGLFENTLHFLDHYANKDTVRLSKGKKCVEIGACACIEDGHHNAVAIAEEGIPVYLPDMPWNRRPLPPLVKRVFSWGEIISDLTRAEQAAGQ